MNLTFFSNTCPQNFFSDLELWFLCYSHHFIFKNQNSVLSDSWACYLLQSLCLVYLFCFPTQHQHCLRPLQETEKEEYFPRQTSWTQPLHTLDRCTPPCAHHLAMPVFSKLWVVVCLQVVKSVQMVSISIFGKLEQNRKYHSALLMEIKYGFVQHK